MVTGIKMLHCGIGKEERHYSSFTSSLWFESVTAQIANDLPKWENVSVVVVIVASDGISIKKSLGGKTLYVSIANLSQGQRAKPEAWRFLGFIQSVS